MVFQRIESDVATLRQIPIAESKIQPTGQSFEYVTGGQRPSWFAIGTRPVSVEDTEQIIPNDFILEQNYPNPFNPTTTIRYYLPQKNNIKIIIYNTLGEILDIVKQETEDTGIKEVTYDASLLSSGIYFYKIYIESLENNKNYQFVKKMTLLK